jgi:glycosyltransferase involved in cell wall biosynthesis
MITHDQAKMTVLHVITGMPVGGAQTVLRQLVECATDEGYRMPIISLSELGTVGQQLLSQGFEVSALNINRSRPTPLDFLRLMKTIGRYKPAVVQTWMYHADLLGGMAARLRVRAPVIWNIRHSDLQLGGIKAKTIMVAKTCARLSKFVPNRIVCNSHYAARLHVEMGYAKNRLIIIPNGIDVNRFTPISDGRIGLCNEIQVHHGAFLIGHFARFHPQKDHGTFIEAAGLVCSQHDNVHFILCGEDIDVQNLELTSLIEKTGHADRFHLLGLRHDMPALMAAMDLTVSSSAFGEGFSNVIGESMASGTPCVATDSGDAAHIIQDTGWVVEKRSPTGLAKAIATAIREDPTALQCRATAARDRIANQYSLPRITKEYLSLYDSALTV